MSQPHHFLSMVEKYINDNFDSLVSSKDNMDMYTALMDIRAMLQSEVAQIEKAESMANHPHAKMVRQNEEALRRKEIADNRKKGVNESMKLSQFIPNKCNS